MTTKKALPETVGALARDLAKSEIVLRKEDGKPATLTFPASSENPVSRWGYDEVLSHADGAIRLARAEQGAMPLLFNHNWDDPVGLIKSARIENKRLIVDATLFDTDRGREIASMIDSGLGTVSIGYRYHVVEEDVDNERYTATDWEPFEVSLVTVPADITVGIGRDLGGDKVSFRSLIKPGSNPGTVSITAARQGVNMTDPVNPAADPKAANVTAVQAEQQRRAAIESLCRANKIDARVEARWIEEGTTLTDTVASDGKTIVRGVASQIVDVLEERGKARPALAAELGLSRGDTQRYSLFRAIRALHFGGRNPKLIEDAAFEIECSRAVGQKLGRELTSSILVPAEVLQRPVGAEAAQRAMATTPGAKGGYLVNVENMGFIDILRNRSVATRMGARNLSGLVGNVVIPRQTGKATVSWQAGEGSNTNASDQALGQLSMTPKTAIAITDVSEQLLKQSSPSAEAFVMADLASSVAIDGIDYAVINGTGGAQPLGIKNTTGVTTGQDAASATYAKILAFVSTAGGSNAIRGNPGFVTNTAGAAKLMTVQRFSSTDTPVWTGNMLDGELVGFRAMSSEQLASANLIFGSWDEVVIGEWGVLELSTDNGGTRFNQAQVGIRAMYMVDVLVRYPQAFVVSVNLS